MPHDEAVSASPSPGDGGARTDPAALPLHGIRVLDFTSMVSGPYCTRLLADMGCEVIKVESVTGDLIRQAPPVTAHGSRYFHAFNGGKRSIAIDLKHPDGAALARRLALRCDVLVENNRPGVMAALGLGADALRADHPALVYCAISGFGADGPMRDWPAYAPIVHALSGFDTVFMRAQGADSAPPVASVQVADVLTGAFAFGAIQSALIKRFRTGVGDVIDSTLIESAMALITGDLQVPQLLPQQRIQTFTAVRAADGFVMPVILTEKAFASLARIIDPQWLNDPRFAGPRARAEHGAALRAGIEAWTVQRPARECQEKLMNADVPCACYATPADVLNNPHLLARDSFTRLGDGAGAFLVNNAPFRFASVATPVRGAAPALGAHTRELLQTLLDLSNGEIDALHAARAVA